MMMTRKDLADRGYEWESDEDEGDDQRQFREDMSEAGREIRFYLGKFYYEGWATVVGNFNGIQGVIRDTSVMLQWDELGKNGFIVYPQ